MGRRLRCLLAHQLVEVTCRTIQSRFLLKPSSAVNLAIKGTIGRAQRYTGMVIVALTFPSNHYHLLLVPESEEQLARFMQFVNTNLSKQIGRIHGWWGALFSRRYQAIPVSHEEAAQVARLRYILEHGAKENLVDKPEDWPGVHCVSELKRGTTKLYGVWHERTRIWRAAQAGRKLRASEKITREVIELSPLPVWESLSKRSLKTAQRELVAHAEQRCRIARGNKKPLGVRAIKAQDPHDRPRHSKRSPAPFAHASTIQVWVEMKRAYREFVKAYRQAAYIWRAGHRVEFPSGCFLPSGAFIARDGPGYEPA